MPEQSILDQALALARKPRQQGFNPFARELTGKVFDRESLTAAALDCYMGRTYDYFQAAPGEKDSESQGSGRFRPGRIEINNLRRIIDTLSNTYGGVVQRTFKKDGLNVKASEDPVIEAVCGYYRDAEIDRVMADMDATLNLVGNGAMRCFFDAKHKELVIHSYRSPMMRVVQNKLNARWPEATVLMGVERDDDGREHVVVEVWTDEMFVELRDGEEIRRTVISELPPLVHCFNSMPNNLTRYWSPCIGPALAHVDRVLNNDLLGPMGYTGVMQGFAQAVIYGADPKSQIVVGPGRIMTFSGDPERRQDFQFVAPNAPLMDVLALVKEMLTAVERAHGIPDGLLDVKTDASGAAIVQANAPLAEMREKRGKIFYRIERDTLRATIHTLAGNDERIGKDVDPSIYDVSVRYADNAVSMSVADKNAREQFLIDLGVLTPGDVAVKEYPDRWNDADEANEEIAERVAEKQEEANAQMETEAAIVAKNAPTEPERPMPSKK